MPFIVIKGTFHLVGQNKNGKPTGFQPDGDSIQFKPNNSKLLKELTQLRLPFKLTKIGSVQLRFEGMDALELHYSPPHGKESRQPSPFAEDSRDFVTKELGLDPVNYAPPKNITVKPPAIHDGMSGYILSRSLEVHGRPVSFVFSGNTTAKDGDTIHLTVSNLKKTVNYQSVLNGFAYPLFYDTLFKDLRNALGAAALDAQTNKRGLWSKDASKKGVKVTKQTDLEKDGIIFPKLFRRLTNYFAAGNANLANFLSFPELTKEQVQDMDPSSPNFTNFTHFDNMIRVIGNKVAQKQRPQTLVFVSEK